MSPDFKLLNQISTGTRIKFYEFCRHQEFPDQYPWEPSDREEFDRLMFLAQSYSPRRFENKLGDPKFEKELIDYLNSLFGESSNTLGPDVVAAYEEYKKEQRIKAEAGVSKKIPNPHQMVQNYIKTVAQTLASDPKTQSLDPETVAYSLINDVSAPQTITKLVEYAIPDSTPIDTAIFMAPTITPLVENGIHPPLTYVYELVDNQFPDSHIVPEANTWLKFDITNATRTNFGNLNHKLEVKINAQGQAIIIPESFSDDMASLDIDLNPEQIIEKSIRLDLNKAGSSEQQIKNIIKIVPLLTSISANTPSKSLDKKKTEQLAVFQNLMEITLSYYFPQRQSKTGLAAHFTWAQAAMTYYQSQQVSQIYNQEYFQRNFGPTSGNPVLSFLFNQGTGYVKDQVTKQAMAKFAASGLGQALGLGAKAATVTAVETGAVAAGTAAAPVTGGVSLLLAIAPLVSEIGKKVLSWGKRNFKKIAIALGAAIGLLIAGPVGAVMGAAGGFVISSPGLSFAKATTSIGNAITAGSTAMVGLVATEIATPIILIAISIPIVIALLLFIINTSALVVPPNMDVFYNSSTELSSLGGAFQDDGLVNKSGCPLLNPTISVTSYSPFSQTGHGSNKYWSAVTGSSQNICRYAIPNRSGCYAPTKGPNNNCLKLNLSACEFYGFALDLVGSSDNVSLPTIDGKETTWSFNDTKYENGSGSSSVGWTFGYNDISGKYTIILTHVNSNFLTGSNLPSGTKLGGLFDQKVTYSDGSVHDNTHLHLEVQVEGKQYVRPENYFCNNK